MPQLSKSLLAFSQPDPATPATRLLDPWGKLHPDRPEQYHPLLCHLIDVAATVEALWGQVLPAPTLDLYCSLIDAEPTEVCRWLTLLAGLHDLGKATPGFQGRPPAQRQRLRQAGWLMPYGASAAHDVLGLMILHGLLGEYLTAEQRTEAASLDLPTVVAAHHGSPVTPEASHRSPLHLGNAAWDDVRHDLFAALVQTAGLGHRAMPAGLARPPRRLLPILGGLVRVADWMASQQTPFDQAECGLDEYPALARSRAEDRAGSLDWGRDDAPMVEFRELFGFDPNEMQRRVARLAGPARTEALVLIEAPTGGGKTEAALHLAHLWEQHGRQAGLYLALPTQATATALHERLRRYPACAGARLLHGGPAAGDPIAASLPTRAGKLLERMTVGTMDQALLGVLSDRQAWVRLLGLANKTVILDEVHAYDTYTSGLLLRLVEWLAALNCSVIVLSATLSARQRAELLKACGALDAGGGDVAYPRVTLAAPTYHEAAPLPAGPQREVHLRRLPRRATLAGELAASLDDGGCAVVICNTVAAAQRMLLRLKRDLPEDLPVELLHARFPSSQRAALERRVIRRFGKNGRRPRRAVLVATQVVEQSLDLDFDLMVSEWAPVDALIQRLGRLHRHDRPRPHRLQEPQLWLLEPPVRDGLPEFGGTGAVYEEAILLRTSLALRERGALVLPRDTEELIESCYGEEGLAECEEPLAARLREADCALAQRRQAQQFAALQVAQAAPGQDGLTRPPPGRTREQETLGVICLQRDGDEYRIPWGPRVDLSRPVSRGLARKLARQALTLRSGRLASALARQPVPQWWQRTPLSHLTPLILNESLTASVGTVRVRLSRQLGLIIENGGETNAVV